MALVFERMRSQWGKTQQEVECSLPQRRDEMLLEVTHSALREVGNDGLDGALRGEHLR